MKRFITICFALVFGILATDMIVKSNQKWESNADRTVRTLTPDILVSHCGQPATDISSGTSRRMFYPIHKSAGLIFTFIRRSGEARWNYESSHLGVPKGKEFVQIENASEPQSWAIIELPCLGK
jgi:hypothetical protein